MNSNVCSSLIRRVSPSVPSRATDSHKHSDMGIVTQVQSQVPGLKDNGAEGEGLWYRGSGAGQPQAAEQLSLIPGACVR